MRLTQHTDYALRVLLFLAARRGERLTTREMADAYGISHHHLHKVVASLGELGVVRLQRGVGGGVELALDPAEISIGFVARGLEADHALVECFDPERDTCVITPVCGLKSVLADALEAFFAVLDGVTLAQLVTAKRSKHLREILGS